jgi:hypothetical protein
VSDILVAEVIVNTRGLVKAMMLIHIETQDILCDLSSGRSYTGKVQMTLEAKRVVVVRHCGKGLD